MPFRAFVSSTFWDLREHREYVIRQLRQSNFDVSAMEDWPADSQEPKAFSQARLEHCDLCVLLVAYRRGSVPPGETLSITQMEYRAAIERGIDVLPFLLKENEDWQHQWTDLDRDPELVVWRRDLQQRHGAQPFDRRPDSVPVAPALASWLQRRTRDFDPQWLSKHVDNLESEFAKRMQCSLDQARQRAIPLLARWRSPEQNVDQEIPFAEFALASGRRAVLVATGGAGKTIALLSLAIEAARKASIDPAAPVPLYGKLNFFDTNTRSLDRLIELLAVPAGLEKDALARIWRSGSRRLLVLLDGFNEIPQDARELPRSCISAVQELLQVPRHGVLLASRPDALLDLLSAPGAAMERAELMELNDERIRDFLTRHGAAALNDQLTGALRDLGRNPFLLWALAQTAGRTSNGELPGNRGQIYREFVDKYLFEQREEGRVPSATRYNYALVKRPVLARLALDMTRRGVTREAADLTFLRKIGAHLKEIQAENEGVLELEPFDFMPNPPAAKNLVAEAVTNGALRQTSDGIEFLHETVRDFFAAVAISTLPLPGILGEVPVTRWSLGENTIQNAGRTPLADALVIFSGLLDSSDELVAGLLDKDPPLAAECLRGARMVSDSVRQAVTERSLELLRSADPVSQALGCRCVLSGCLRTPPIVDALRDLASSESLAVAVGALSAASKFDLPAKRSIMIPALARTRLSAPAIACMGLLRESEKAPLDLGLLLSLSSLIKEPGVSTKPEGVSLPSILEEVAALFAEGPSLDQLIASMTQPGKSSAASLLIRLTYAQAAVARIAETVSSIGDSQPELLLTFMLPIACGANAVPVLMKLLRDTGDRLAQAAVAGVGLRHISTETLGKQESPIPVPELREMFADASLPLQTRLGAALALTGDSEARRRVLEWFSGPAETPEMRGLFCSTCLMQPPQQSWLLSIGFSQWGLVPELTDFLVERALGDPDAQVREMAAKALSNSARGEGKLLDKLNDSAAPPEIRGEAAAALGFAGCASAREPLLKLALDPVANGPLLPGVVRGLASLLDDAAEKTLEEVLLTGPEEAEPILPALVLARARGDVALDRMERWLLDPQMVYSSRRRVLEGLKGLMKFGYGSVERLWNVSLHAQSEALRIGAAWAASAASPAETVEAFRTVILDASQTDEVREQAAVALAFLDGDAAAAALEEIEKNTSDPFACASARFGRWLAAEHKANNELPSRGARLLEHALDHTQAGSWRTGIADCDAGLQETPDIGAFYCFRATCYAGLGQIDEAIADAQKAVGLDPDNLDFAVVLAWVYEKGGRTQEALAAYRDLARREPDDLEHQAKIGWYAYRMGELPQSIEASRRSSELGSKEPNVLFNLGLALLANGETTDALFAYGYALSVCSRLSAEESEVNVNDALGDLAELAGRRPELLPAIERARQTLGKGLKSVSA